MFLPKNGLIATGISLLQTLFSFGELTRDFRRYPWYITRDIRRYPWYITRDITAAISRVIYHGYLRISSCLCHGYRSWTYVQELTQIHIYVCVCVSCLAVPNVSVCMKRNATSYTNSL